MIQIDMKEIKKLERTLEQFRVKAIPSANVVAKNSLAFITAAEYRKNAQDKLTLRNKWTLRTIGVNKAKFGTSGPSRVGSTADYMEKQEFGSQEVKTGKYGVAIPTSYSAGQAEGSKPRLKAPKKINRMESITLGNRRRKGNRKQANLQAIKSGEKFVFLDLRKTQGIFRILGPKKRPKIKMIWDLSRKTVRNPANPMLKPAADLAVKRGPEEYLKALQFQVSRLR